jgi:FkbM family methyltransferase
MLSYAQNAEDVVLQRVFRDVAQGFYVDVGASAPVDDSVTYHFYQRGWHGVNVEPDRRDYDELVAARTRDINVNAAVGRGDGPVAFYPSTVRGQGTVLAELAGSRGSGDPFDVEQISLSRIFEDHSPPEGVEFLKVDAEGSEADVLASSEWRRWRPRVVVVEAVDSAGAPTHEAWEPRLLEQGYQFALFDGLNRFYCRDEDQELLLPTLAAPANILDNWRPAREVALQEVVQARLEEVEAAREATQRGLESTQRELESVQRELESTQRELDAARRELAAESSAHSETRRELEGVYDSTSWRVSAPLRGASRLAQRLLNRT